MTAGAAGDGGPPTPVPAPSPSAVDVFGPSLATAETYARMLADEAVSHGHLGPREVPRLWDRHLVNSALMADLVPARARVVDVGSGAGLPGLPVAIRRPDLRVVLVEPMERRVAFLGRAVEACGLAGRVEVVRGRADDPDVLATVAPADWVVARAVAPVDRLVRWCVPLLRPGGVLLALKGRRAAEELAEHATAVSRAGGVNASIESLGSGDTQTWVIRIERGVRARTKGRR